ncbi:tetratricopeptide repeat protein [Candidatus Sumerlaeota bacterium]|nr:tetratricopeptide repeat protein [Candidatus Sumerlaeota bacterium]
MDQAPLRSPATPPVDRGSAVLFLAVAALALIVRAVLLIDLRDSPTFLEPIVDAGVYDSAARNFIANKRFSDAFFWQPFFYPFFLSMVYSIGSPSILLGKVLHVLVGAATCGLTALLGKRIADWRTGLLAGILLSLCAPLAFLETELLATVFEAFWAVALVGFFVGLRPNSPLATYLGLGICGGLSAITRPTFLPFFAVTCLWQGFVLQRGSVKRDRIAFAAVLTVLGFLVVVAPVSVLHHKEDGSWSFLPTSGGINLYIGNNPDSDRTVAIRPGWAWDRLTLEPRREGLAPSDAERYFADKVRDYVLHEPMDFVGGLATKSLQFVSSREIPRNIDIYVYREWSPFLRGLVWKWGRFGFPFGAILPLAVVGLVAARKKIPPAMWLFLLLYPACVVLVFVSSRYRAPVLPILAVVAGAGAMHLWDLARGEQWRPLLTWGIVSAAIVAIASAPGPFPQETTDYKAEMYYCLGSRSFDRGEDSEAVRRFEKALASRPDYPEALDKLGTLSKRNGDRAGAEARYRAALEANPVHEGVCLRLGALLEETGKTREAETLLRRAVELDPFNADAHNQLGVLLGRSGRDQEALPHFLTSVRLSPKDAGFLTNLGASLFQTGRTDKAIECYRRALAIDPELDAARRNLEAALAHRERDQKGRAANPQDLRSSDDASSITEPVKATP